MSQRANQNQLIFSNESKRQPPPQLLSSKKLHFPVSAQRARASNEGGSRPVACSLGLFLLVPPPGVGGAALRTSKCPKVDRPDGRPSRKVCRSDGGHAGTALCP